MKLSLIFIFIITLIGCAGNKSETDGSETGETAQQVGDVMASVDEVGGSSGAISSLEKSVRKTFARYAPGEIEERRLAHIFIPEAQATSCSTSPSGFGSCSGTSITRNFSSCTIGSAVFTGSVLLTWSGTGVTTCGLNQTTNVITRVPSFTVAGRRSATLTVSKSGTVGQWLTWQSGTTTKVFTYNSDGIQRKFTTSTSTLFDHTTRVTSPITVTGQLRSGRVMSGGALEVKNNVTNVTCSFVPSNVTWGDNACNCPNQGTWQGTCSDSKSVSLVISGCGTGTYTEGTETSSVTFDRCGT